MQRCDGIVQLRGLGGADDGRGYTALGQYPGQCDLRHRHPALCGQLFHGIDHATVFLFRRLVKRLAGNVGSGPLGLLTMGPGQPAACHRAPRHQADPLIDTQRDHLALFFAIDQVQVVLHRDEPAPAMRGRDLLGLGELPCVHGRRADVPGLAGLDHIVQGFHGFFDGRVIVPAMDLVQVDIVSAEPGQARVDTGHDGLAREPLFVGAGRAFPHVCRKEHLRCDHGLVATCELFEQFTDDGFRSTCRVAVGRVKKIDALLDGVFDDRSACFFAQCPGMRSGIGLAECHASQAQSGNIQSCVAKLYVVHESSVYR